MESPSTYKKIKPYLNLFISAISLLVAYGLITYINYGLYIVLGYIFYSIQNTKGLQLINAEETNIQLNILHKKILELSTKQTEK